MSEKIKRRVIAMVLATSIIVSTIPVQLIAQTTQTIKAENSLNLDDSISMMQQTTEGIIELKAIELVKDNKIRNFSFEEVTTQVDGQWGSPQGAREWYAKAFGGTYSMPKVTIDTVEKISGEHSVKLESIDGKARGWIQQSIAVEPDTTYILESYMKAAGVNGTRFGVQVLEYVGNATNAITTDINQTLKLRIQNDTTDWKKYDTEFKTAGQTTRIELRAYLGTDWQVAAGGKAWIDDIVLTEKAAISNDADLAAVVLSEGTLSPDFASGTTAYTASVANGISSITVTPTVNESHATVRVNNNVVTSGQASGAINLSVGINTVTVVVTAQDGTTTKSYTITVTRAEAIEAVKDNKVRNFSFEEVTTQVDGQWGSPQGASEWYAKAFGGTYSMPKVTIDTVEKISGEHSVKLESIDGKARGWIQQSIAVKPNTTYILEGYMKAQDVSATRFGVQVLEYVGNATNAITTDTNKTLKLRIKSDTIDWQKYDVEFKTAEQTTRIELRAYLGTDWQVAAGGKAWIDDIVLIEKAAVEVKEIITPEKERVAVGDIITLKPIFIPVDASNQKVTWVSEDEQIATVSASGMVKGIREGQVIIKVRTDDGGHEAATEITVERGTAINLIDNGSFEKTMQVTDGTQIKYWKDKLAPESWNSLWVPTPGEGLQLVLDKTEFSEGMQSILIISPTLSRISFSTSRPIDSSKEYRLSMNIKTENVIGTGAYFRVQYLDKDNKKTQDAVPASVGVKGTKDWDNYELALKNIPAHTVTIRVEVFFENATGKAWIDDARLVETYSFSLNKSNAKLVAGETMQLEALFGLGVSDKKVEWMSSNELVAVVDPSGMVTTIAPGLVTITARTIDGNSATCSISVEDPKFIQEYKALRKKWSDYMTINNIEDKNNIDYKASMVSLAEQVQKLWDDMNKYNSELENIDTRKELWATFSSNTISAHLTSTMANLHMMARAYASEGCSLYQNESLGKDILAALDWFYANRYNEDVKMYNNWWDWDIGVPQKLNDILVLMYDNLSEAQLEDHLRAINRFVPTPVSVPGGPNPLTGANLLDTAMVSAVSGMIEGSNRRLIEARDALSEVLPYVTKGDGFYEDGSFIQHTDFPYAGGYGGVLMSGISNLLFITDNTSWEVTDPLIENVYDWIINAFEPLYYKGAIMDMVSGRGISRHNSSDHNKGKGLLPKMLGLSETAPEAKKIKIKAFIKENVIADSVCETGYFEKMNINDLLAFKKLLADDNIPARGDLVLHKVYGAMDRTVHHRPGFSIGISMHSSRVAAYEVGNGENKKAWHTADGMLYLYNGDGSQYGDDFWPTIDPMRLPGTTTDSSGRTNKDWAHNTSSKAWVGGSSISDLYGATGMEFEMEPGRSNLTGKKSWFMFDDEIVALGSGINATGNRQVETIVENRKIKASGDNTFIVDGNQPLDAFGEINLAGAKWALLAGDTSKQLDTIGYYFPEYMNIKAIRETRTGNWNAINGSGPTTPINKNYLSLAIGHGNNPTDAKYSYVILPNKTAEEVAAYSNQADITIINNTSAVQAVRENKLGILGINFWNPSKIDYITVENPCSIMINEGIEILELGISDPTHLEKEVKVILDKKDYEVISQDDTVSVQNLDNQIEIIVRTDKSMGKTHKLKLISRRPVSILKSFTPVTLIQSGDVANNNVQYGNAAAVIAALPTEIEVILENATVVNIPVIWADTDTYNAGIAGTYIFTATWGAMPAGVSNTGNVIAPIVEVTVVAGKSNANLSGLVLNSGTLSPDFAVDTTAYRVSVANGMSSITVTPTSNEIHAKITVNGNELTSGQTSEVVDLNVGSNTITVVVTAHDGTSTKTYTITVIRAVSSNGGSDNGSSSGGSTTITASPTKQDPVVVIVNNKSENAGTLRKTTEAGKSVVTVELNNQVIEGKIEETINNNPTGTNNVIQILVADTKSEVVKVELTGDIVKKLEENTFDISIKSDKVEYLIPAKEFNISNVVKDLGLSEESFKDIKIEVRITKLDESVVAKYNEVANANGVELVFLPVEFKIVAKTTKADGITSEVEISKFSNYVARIMEIPAGVEPRKITTGIVFNPHGIYSHVPTEVLQKDGKWYAKLNSLTNSNYSVIWNTVTVKSVEKHWSKDAVNDMASRLVIFNTESFDPNKAITRADFAEYIIRALGLYREGSAHENKFKDVTAEGGKTLAIFIANEYGIITGYPDGTFRPDQHITREEAMTMYSRAMKVTKLLGVDQNRYQNYTDYTQVGSWARSYVKEVLAGYVFSGTTATTISPKSNLTYAEAALAIKNLLVESKLINKNYKEKQFE